MEGMPVDYTANLDQAIARLHEEGRYRTFIDIEERSVPSCHLAQAGRVRDADHRMVWQ